MIAGWNKDKHNCMSGEGSLSSQPSGKLYTVIVLERTIALYFSKKGILLISIIFNVIDKHILTVCFRELTCTNISINTTHVLCTQQYVKSM